MARQRKNPKAESGSKWLAALYIRLSREDGNDESYSVQNQRQRLTAFLENPDVKAEIELAGAYIDDGCTGTDSERPELQRLLSDIDAGKVNCVIVKDLSRLSRNDWECKRYLQHIFVVRNVRFISLELPKLDSFKNPDEVYELGVSIQSMYNENHCRETSIKVRGTLDAKRRRGEFIGAFAPFGYLKDPSDKHRLIVDEGAAAVVRRIFNWYVYGGMSKNGIVRRLTAMGTPCPTAYKCKQGMEYRNPAALESSPQWSTRSVSAILANRAYLGDMVQGKQRVKSYKIHTRVSMPESEWYIVEKTHEPIIDSETFKKAGERMSADTRAAPMQREVYTFSGLLHCKDCGGSMVRRSSRGIVYYACRTYVTQGLCSRHSIRQDKLEEAVLEAIRKQITLQVDMERLLGKLRSAAVARAPARGLEIAIAAQKQELEKTKSHKSGLYLDWKNGEISREEYHTFKTELEEKLRRLQQDLACLEEERVSAENEAEKVSYDSFFMQGNIDSLDRSIVIELIKAIYVHSDKGITIDFSFTENRRSCQ